MLVFRRLKSEIPLMFMAISLYARDLVPFIRKLIIIDYFSNIICKLHSNS